jgi:hypothetical protein
MAIAAMNFRVCRRWFRFDLKKMMMNLRKMIGAVNFLNFQC